jgi:hypothetical protein
MAKILKNVFIAGVDEIVQDYTVESWHVSQSVDAFTGASDYDITISGSLTVVGPTVGSFTGSLQGTSSNAVSSSFSLTASFVQNAQTASYVLQAVSSSFASTASFVQNAQTSSYVLNAVSSSFASTASFLNTLNQSVILTGSLNTTGSVTLRGLTTQSNSFLVTINNLTGQLAYTSSAAAIAATTPGGSSTQIQYNNAGAFAGVPTLTYDGTTLRATGSFTGSFVGNLTGNATNLSTNRTNWATNGTITAVVGQLAWRNYGNNHTIFDASAGASPEGVGVNNTNPSVEWNATRPTLMGWNGTDTFGVRVDSSRYAENIKNAGTVTLASPIENNEITITQPTIVINTPVKLLNFRWYSDTWSIGNVRSNTATSLGLGIFLNSTEVGRFSNTSFSMFNRDIIAFASSDKRLKDNITPISNPIKKIQKIGGYEFDWNDKQDTYEGHDIGVIAQEIEEVLPELVTTRDNGYKAVKYDKIVALLIEAIKDQQKQIDELKSKIK